MEIKVKNQNENEWQNAAHGKYLAVRNLVLNKIQIFL